MKAFVDTNIWVYTHDRADTVRRARALDALNGFSDHDLVLSAQVLNEFFTVVTGRLAVRVPRDIATRSVEAMRRFTVVPLDADLISEAIDLGGRVSISHWDALIVRAAARSGCDVLLTEDLASDTVIDGVRIVNPLR